MCTSNDYILQSKKTQKTFSLYAPQKCPVCHIIMYFCSAYSNMCHKIVYFGGAYGLHTAQNSNYQWSKFLYAPHKYFCGARYFKCATESISIYKSFPSSASNGGSIDILRRC
jgi:hypothetical protein